MNNIFIMLHNFRFYTIILSYTLQTIQENKVTVEHIYDKLQHQQFQHVKPKSIYPTFIPFNMAFTSP